MYVSLVQIQPRSCNVNVSFIHLKWKCTTWLAWLRCLDLMWVALPELEVSLDKHPALPLPHGLVSLPLLGIVKEINTNHSGINIFLLISGRFNIVCWINTEMGLVDYLPIRPCLFLHAFLEKPNTSLISRTSKGQNLFSESICKQNNSVHWIRVPLLILYNPIELSEYRNLFLIIV